MFYKLRDKERSKESAYVLVGFLARPFVSFVSHIARYAPFTTDKSSSLSNPAQLNFRTPLAQLQRQNLFSIKFQSVFAPLSFQLVDYQ